MRLAALWITILTGCLGVQTAGADIYVWTGENGVKNFTSGNPPPRARIYLRTPKIPESVKHQKLRDARAEIRAREARIEARQAEIQRQIAAADRITKAARQTQTDVRERAAQPVEQPAELQRRIDAADQGARAMDRRPENPETSGNDRYNPRYGQGPAHLYLPSQIKCRHFRSPKRFHRSHGGSHAGRSPKFFRERQRFKTHQFKGRQRFHEASKGSKYRRYGVRKYKMGRHHVLKRHFRGKKGLRFRGFDGGRSRFHGHRGGGFRGR